MHTATRQQTVTQSTTAAPTSVRVEIFDQVYNLRGTDPDYIARLAEYVDTKMRTIAEQTSTIDSLRLAVLAALNIADEYHILKRKQESAGGDYQQRAQRLSGLLDEVLQDKHQVGERSA
jgi:cell division protein ZapA